MSAKLAAAAEDPELEERYKERYDEADAEIVGLTEETLNLFRAPEVERRFEEIKGPMNRLLALEDRAFASVGFGRDEANIRNAIVGVVGAVYLLVGVLGFVFPPSYFGAIPSGYTVADNLVHLAFGALALAAVFLSRGGEPTTRRA